MISRELIEACKLDFIEFCRHKVKHCAPAELTAAAHIPAEAYAEQLLRELCYGSVEAAIHIGTIFEVRAPGSADGKPHTFNFGDYKPGGTL